MADRNLVKELRRWATEEFHLPQDSLPNDSYFKALCVGTGKSIWTYIIQHVFQPRNVRIMRGNLQWYKSLKDKEEKQAEDQSEAAKRRELLKKMEQVRAEISQLDSQISETEEQLATQERSISLIWDGIRDNQGRDLLLQAFRKRCSSGRNILSDDISRISEHCQSLDHTARKAEIEVLFDDEPSSQRDEDHISMAAEAQVLRELRELCEDRIHFYQSLQESELKMQQSADKHVTCEQRTAVFRYWLTTAEKVLGDYPPNHVLSALQYLASREQKRLEEKLAALDVTQDVTALRVQYESSHLQDISAEEDKELPPVRSLLEDTWEEVQQSFVELTQTRLRIQQLKNQLQARKKEAQQEVSGVADELLNDSLLHSAFEVELQCVMQAARRDYIRERCVQLDHHAKGRQEELRSLCSQWQSILDFRKLVVLRQEHIRGLIKGNSTAKTRLVHLQKELQEFIESRLVPQFEVVIAAANSLRSSVSKEAKQFGTVSLLSLDCRTIDGTQRVPASRLSIYRVLSPNFSSLCQSLTFPLYKAPEDLCAQSRSQQLELRFLRQLLHLHTITMQRLQKETEQLHASDQKTLLARVMEEDQNLLKSLLPRARNLTSCCAKGFSYGEQVKLAISDWWDKPAQHVLPELTRGGLTFQQWLQRWKLAAKAS